MGHWTITLGMSIGPSMGTALGTSEPIIKDPQWAFRRALIGFSPRAINGPFPGAIEWATHWARHGQSLWSYMGPQGAIPFS